MKESQKAVNLYDELNKLRPIKPADEQRIMQKFKLDWNYHSNNLEGNSLTFGETKALLLFGITAQGKPLKDHFEITGHNDAINLVLDVVKSKRPLTENFIRELHKLILKEPYYVNAATLEGEPTKKLVQVGKYKSTPNHVLTNTGEIFRFANPEETPILMNELVKWFTREVEKDDINPILLASEFHYRFIRIHPFDDGNGRTARILMNFILIQYGYPPVVIKTEDKQNYFSVLRQADAGKLEPFIEYISKNLNESLGIMIKGAKGESIEDPDDIDKEIAILNNRLKSIGEKVEVTKNKETIKKFYEDSLVNLYNTFLSKCKLLNEFYINHKVLFYFNSTSTLGAKQDPIEHGRRRINDNTNSMRVQYEYNGFNNIGFQKTNHKSVIGCKFDFSKVIIKNSTNVKIEKFYGEALTEEEINELVTTEIRKHKDLIESKINEIQDDMNI